MKHYDIIIIGAGPGGILRPMSCKSSIRASRRRYLKQATASHSADVQSTVNR